MAEQRDSVLVLGSGPNAVEARNWGDLPFDAVVAINNAWALRPDWTHHIHPEDFPPERRPEQISPSQTRVDYNDYVPCQNAYGGVVYAGGTMAFTTGYWALARLRPRVMSFFGCDMVYPAVGQTHFYGTGTADPLREDPTLRSLEAKAARLGLIAARQGCACVNLSMEESRLVFPRAALSTARATWPRPAPPVEAMERAEALEREAGYHVPSGRYWKEQERFDLERIDAIDRAWMEAFEIWEGVRA